MPRLHPAPRLSLAACCVALSVIGLLGCSPAPEPEPTPTPAFASEEEAFAAAEETYRALTAALNRIDTRDPGTFEPLYALSSGDFEEADREAYSRMHEEGYVIAGETVVISFEGRTFDSTRLTVVADVCLDVSQVTVVDAQGISQVSPDRPDRYALLVTFVGEGDRMLTDSAEVNEDGECAS